MKPIDGDALVIEISACMPDDYGEQTAYEFIMRLVEDAPTIEPEWLTDDDFETIRIHLNAYKEKLCNQQRWEEADEYQRIIDRFMAFASAQPEIIRCKDCKHHRRDNSGTYYCVRKDYGYGWGLNDFCSRAERREEE